MFVALLSNNSYPCAAFDKSTNISLPLTWVVTFVYLLHTTIYSSRMSHLIKSSQDGYSSLLREETEEPYSSRTAMSFFFMDTECEDYSEVDNDTIFSYLFFHIVFACSLMYTAKFFTNWSLITHEGNNIYISPTNLSFYLRIGAAWGTIAMLSWTLMAPLILPDTFP